MSAGRLTWLAPAEGQSTRDFLGSVHDLVRSFPEPFIATAIPMGSSGILTMLHVIAATAEGDLVQFSDSIVRQFETLAARFIAELSQSELEAAQSALDAREIGALSAASHEELAVVVGRKNVKPAQEQISALLASHAA